MLFSYHVGSVGSVGIIEYSLLQPIVITAHDARVREGELDPKSLWSGLSLICPGSDLIWCW